MKSLILKNESRILVRCYREFLIKGVNDTPMQFIQRMQLKPEVSEFVLPYLISTETWYSACKELYEGMFIPSAY